MNRIPSDHLGTAGQPETLEKNKPVSFVPKDKSLNDIEFDGECQIDEVTDNLTQRVIIQLSLGTDRAAWIGRECRNAREDSAVDLSMLLIDKSSDSVSIYLYDIKETFHGINVIAHFANQAYKSLMYAKEIIQDANARHINTTIGVLVGLFSKQRLEQTIVRAEQEAPNHSGNLSGIQLKAVSRQLGLNKAIENAKMVLDGKIKILNVVFELNIHAYKTAGSDEFEAQKAKLSVPIIHIMSVTAKEVDSVKVHHFSESTN